MVTVYKHEMKTYLKNLLIWTICVGGIGFACILLFSGMKESMQDMEKSFASMGAFSDAFGMSQLSISTLPGFYAAEVGAIYSLGGAMFAAILCTTMLSKEEDGHTCEFLYSLPIARKKAVFSKWLAAISHIALFNVICIGIYLVGFAILGENIPAKEFAMYHIMQFIMHIQLGTICYAFSAISKRNKLGIGMGIVLLLYAYDLMARVIPDLSDFKFISPFSYANASDIFSSGEIATTALILGICLLLASLGISFGVYTKKSFS